MLRIIFLTTLILLSMPAHASPWSTLSDITQVIRNTSFAMKPRDMLRDFEFQRTAPCSGSVIPLCPKKIWEEKIKELAGLSRSDKIREVNSFFNTFRYISDGTKDIYATPFELISRNGGDCEDIAFAKILMLVELGFNAETSYVAIAKTPSGVWHAYGLVPLGDEWRRLDLPAGVRTARPIFLITIGHILAPFYHDKM